MKLKKFLAAFTLIELLVVISIIAILAGIALPVFSQVQIKGAQTKALSNAKQIGLACKIYATDNSGLYPVAAATTHSNLAFAQLFPQYLTNETIFWLAKSAECSPNQPDNVIDPSGTTTPVSTLDSGENHWAYVNNLTDTSNAAFPLVADCFSDSANHYYSTQPAVEGGVWSGSKAVVIHADVSGAIDKCTNNGGNQMDMTGPPATAGGAGTDLFSSTGTSWLASGQTVINP